MTALPAQQTIDFIMSLFRALLQILGCLTVVIVPLLPIRPAAADDPAVLEGTIASTGGQLFPIGGGRFLTGAKGAKVGTTTLVIIDPATRERQVIAADLPRTVVVATTNETAVLWEIRSRTLVSLDLASGRRVERCCFEDLERSRAADGELRILDRSDGSYRLRAFDLATLEDRGTATLPLEGAPVLWDGGLILINQRAGGQYSHLTVYDRNLQAIGSEFVPYRTNDGCGARSWVVGQILFLMVRCNDLALYDIAHAKYEKLISLPSTNGRVTMLDAADGLAFAATGVEADGTGSVTVVDLPRGQEVATLPIAAAADLRLSGGRLLASNGNWAEGYQTSIYRLDRARLGNAADVRQRTTEHLRAGLREEQRSPANQVIRDIEAGSLAPLLDDVGALSDQERALVAGYARLLLRSTSRIERGLELLEDMQRSGIADPSWQRWMSAGRVKLALLHGEAPQEADLRVVGETRAALEERQAESARWSKEVPFDLGYSVKTYFADDRIYVARYGSYAGSSLACSVLLAYDRATFQLVGVVPIAGCDDEQQDSITDVVVNDTTIFVAVEHRFPDLKRIDLVTIRKSDLSIQRSYALMSGINRLAVRPDGLATCNCHANDNFCVVRNAAVIDDNTGVAAPVSCDAVFRAYPALPSFGTISDLDKGLAVVCAINDRYLATCRRGLNGYLVRFYAANRSGVPIVELAAGDNPEVELPTAGVLAVLSSSRNRSVQVTRVDLASGVDAEVLWLDTKEYPHRARAGDLLYIGTRHTLMIYDLAKQTLLDVVPDFIPPGAGGRRVISDLKVDGNRLFVFAGEGRRTRVITLDAAARTLQAQPTPWQRVDRLLAAN